MSRSACLLALSLSAIQPALAAGDSLPRLVAMPTPDYPAAAASLGVEGTCSLYVVVSQDGALQAALPQGCPRAFQASAEEALRAATWAPAQLDGAPVTASSRVTLEYRRR